MSIVSQKKLQGRLAMALAAAFTLVFLLPHFANRRSVVAHEGSHELKDDRGASEHGGVIVPAASLSTRRRHAGDEAEGRRGGRLLLHLHDGTICPCPGEVTLCFLPVEDETATHDELVRNAARIGGLDEHTGGLSDTLRYAELHIAVATDGEWVIPACDRALRCIRAMTDTEEYKLGSGLEVAPGSYSHELVVRSGEFGILSVVHSSGFVKPPVEAVREDLLAFEGNQVTSIRLSGGSLIGGLVDGAKQPTDGSRILALELTNVLRVPLSDFNRTIWVQAENHAWYPVDWPAGVRERTLDLRSFGRLRLNLDNHNTGNGGISLILHVAGERVGSWSNLRRSTMVDLTPVRTGPFKVDMLRHHRGGVRLIHSAKGTIDADKLTVVSLDVGGLVAAAVPPGTVSLRIDSALERAAYRSESLASSEPRVIVCEMIGERLRPPSFSRKLEDFPVRGSSRWGNIPDIMPGNYFFAIPELGAYAIEAVVSGEATQVYLDAADAAIVHVWTEGAASLPATEAGALEWSLRVADEQIRSRIASILDSDPVGRTLRCKPVPLVDGGWRIACLPGDFAAAFVSYVDGVRGYVHEVSVVPGLNDIVATGLSESVSATYIELIGVKPSQRTQLKLRLESSIVMAESGEEVEADVVPCITGRPISDSRDLVIVLARSAEPLRVIMEGKAGDWQGADFPIDTTSAPDDPIAVDLSPSK